MTTDELKKEAEQYAEGMAKYYASTHEDCIPSQFEKYLRNAYISSAEPREKRIAELETRCNELFLQTCEQAEKIKELNAEIENDRDLPAIAYMQGAEKQKKKDEEELQKWKDEWQEQVQKATDEGYARTLQTIQLTKAKEIIKAFLDSSDLNIKHKAEEFLGEF